MEFYELIEKIVDAIPDGYENVRRTAEMLLPWILGVCTGATCLFGHAIHKVWNAFLFFWIGFLVPMLIIQGLFAPTGAVFWVCAFFSAALGVACAFFSKKIYKVYLFVSTFVIVFIAVPSYLTFLGDSGSVIAGLVLAVAAAILSMKYKYLTVIITTAFSGSFMLFGIIEGETGLSHAIITVLAVIFALIGLAVQCFVEREELKETYEHIKEKKSQISSAPKKIKEKIGSKKSDPVAEAEKEEQ